MSAQTYGRVAARRRRAPETAWTVERLEPRTLLAAVSFAVDPALSRITISGDAAGLPVQQQGPGSLSTTYRGTLHADVTSSFIHFPGGSSVAADNSGNWRPEETGNG